MKLKKCIALLLTASLMSSVAGCSKQFDETMTSVADKACKSVIADNYKKVESCLDGKNKNLESAMDLESDDDTVNDAIKIILSTMNYEVDEDSLESDFFGKEGTIDVTFSIVDYESILDDSNIFRDMEDFEETIEDCKDTIDTTITFEFEKQDGKPVIVNSDDLIELFSFKEEVEIILAGTLLDHIEGSGYFVGDAMVDIHPYTDEYMDTNRIEAVFDLDELGTELEWEYSYEISMDGFITLYDSDTMTKPEGSSTIDIVYEDYSVEYLQDATYVVYLYDESGFVEISCEVSHTEPEPEPEPEPISNGTLIELPYYVDPNSDPALLPGGDYQVAVPSGFSILPVSDPIVQQTASSELGQCTCCYMTDPTNLEFAWVYLTPGYLDYFREGMPDIVDIFADGLASQCTVEEVYSEQRTIADQTVDLYIIKVTSGFYTTYYGIFLLDCGDHGYFADMSAPSLEEFDEYIGCISHV